VLMALQYLDEPADRQDQAVDDNLRSEDRHDLCFPGSCGEEGRRLL